MLEIIQTLEMKICETFSKTHLCVEGFDTQKGLHRKALVMKKNLTIYTEAFKNKSVSMIKSTFSQNKRAYT